MTTLSLSSNSQIFAANVDDIEIGRRIYQEGILSSDQALHGQRPESGEVEGKTAACINCHRKSGMGSLEGNIRVLPITGNFLFVPEDRPIALLDPRAAKNITRPRASYTEASLAQAIRSGTKVDGSVMHSLMPRYDLNDADIKALTAYLRQLSTEVSPGVGEDTLRFATVVTPGIEPKKKEAFLNMMRNAFMQRNASQQNISGRMRMPIDMVPHTIRNWELSVWEPQGAPETWAAQLAEFNRQIPVFAVISGLSNTDWTPIHQFCEQEHLPCLFPSTPITSDQQAYYPRYFNKGVVLEAEVLARYLQGLGAKVPKRLVQVFRDTDLNRKAVRALKLGLQNLPIVIEELKLPEQGGDIKQTIKSLKADASTMFWLTPADIAAVSKVLPAKVQDHSYSSGILSEARLKDFGKSWQTKVRLVYPYEIGDKQRASLAKVAEWLKTWHIPEVDPIMQAEVFFNLLTLTDLTSQMLDNLYRDYLIERAEDMLSWGTNVTAYPHLSLGNGQMFASKGAYIARFDKDGSLTPESAWIVP